jgi:HEAT repeat protein
MKLADTNAPLAKTALSSDDWIVRRRAIIELSHSQSPELYELFSYALADPVSEVRHAAIIALTRQGNRDAVQMLAKPKFLKSPDINIRWATVRALGQIGDIPVIDTLIPLVDDEEWLVRNEVISVLLTKVQEIIEKDDPSLARILIRMLGMQDARIAKIATEGLITMEGACRIMLLEALKSIKEPVRVRAALILGQAKDREALLPLINTLQDSSPIVRAEAAKSLGKIGDTRAIPHLVNGLQDYNDLAKRAFAQALILLGTPALQPLHSELAHASNKLSKAAILSALGEIGHPSSIPLLIEHLNSSFYIVRNEAVNALSRYGRQVVEPLIQMLSYSKSDISLLLTEASGEHGHANQIRAIKALGDLEDHRAANLLKELLVAENSNIASAAQEALVSIGCSAWGRCGALAVLGAIGDTSIIPNLLPSLEDDSPHVRYEAIRALGRLKGQVACKQIKELMTADPFQEVRTEALKVLRELSAGSTELFDSALKAIADVAPSVRLEAARVLGDFADDRALDVLIERMSDTYWSVRMSAENAICNYGKRVIPKLISLLNNPEYEGRCRIISALARIGDQRAIKPLESLLAESGEQARLQALIKEALRLLKGETGRQAVQAAMPLC